ncbi:ATP-binding protein [Rhodopila globiformis]|nr:ATP-binding protein [Rhodopila globiformis]
MRAVRLRLPVTAVLLPTAILFAAASPHLLPPGYARLALPLLAIAATALIAELVVTLPWGRPVEAEAEEAPDAGPAGSDAVPIPNQADAAPALTELRYRAFFDHAEDSLCDIEITPDGRFLCLDINPHAEAVIGKTAASIRGQTPEQILGPEAGGRIAAALRRCVAQNGLRYEEIWQTVRGPRLTDTIMVPLRAPDAPSGPYARILCSIRDITDRRQLETQVAQGQRLQALGQLAGGIAHDFNNVLQAVEGAVSLIERRAGDAESVRRLARSVLDAAARGSSITRRLLTFTRGNELRSEAFGAAELVRGLREVLASTLEANIAVRIDLPEDLPLVQADKSLVETALVNLATNARDAMPRGGTLTLGAWAETVDDEAQAPPPLRPGAYVRFEVSDTGHGMDAATLAHATEPFFTTKPRGQGTGLGLSIARGFAEQSGGALAIASVRGQGTTISIWLPQARAAGGAARADGPEAAEPPAPADGRRVLVVDDDPLVCETVSETLQTAGYVALCAGDAEAALPMLRRTGEVDLLLTDFSMPGMNGVDLIKEAQRLNPGLPAIVMTGYAGDVEGLSSEATAHTRFVLLRKPVSARALFAQLATLLPEPAAPMR